MCEGIANKEKLLKPVQQTETAQAKIDKLTDASWFFASVLNEVVDDQKILEQALAKIHYARLIAKQGIKLRED